MAFKYSPLAFANDMYEAGFRVGKGIVIGLAVVAAESAFDPDAKNTTGNTPPSTDRGIVQFNSYWHPEISDECAFDPKCSAIEFFRVSKQGSDFTPWAVYNSGSYAQYMNWAWAIADGMTQIRALSQRVNSLEFDNATLQSSLAAHDKDILDLNQAVAGYKSQIADLNVKIEQIQTADSEKLQAAIAAKNMALVERDVAKGELETLILRVEDYFNKPKQEILYNVSG